MNVAVSPFGLCSIFTWKYLLENILRFSDVNIIECNNKDNLNIKFDFVILDGGEDVNPKFYGEELHKYTHFNEFRDNFEYTMFCDLFPTQAKFVGICRGLQFLNVMLGGTLYQHLSDAKIGHGGMHDIVLNLGINNSLYNHLSTMITTNMITVNSMHHQGIKELGKDLVPIALESKTGLIEAIEIKDKLKAVQFHPEFGAFRYCREILEWLFS